MSKHAKGNAASRGAPQQCWALRKHSVHIFYQNLNLPTPSPAKATGYHRIYAEHRATQRVTAQGRSVQGTHSHVGAPILLITVCHNLLRRCCLQVAFAITAIAWTRVNLYEVWQAPWDAARGAHTLGYWDAGIFGLV